VTFIKKKCKQAKERKQKNEKKFTDKKNAIYFLTIQRRIELKIIIITR